jgi:hypothetical protein
MTFNKFVLIVVIACALLVITTQGQATFEHFAFTRLPPMQGDFDVEKEPKETYWGFRQTEFDISTLAVGPREIVLSFPDEDSLPSLELDSFFQDGVGKLVIAASFENHSDVWCESNRGSIKRAARQVIFGQITCPGSPNWNFLTEILVVIHPETKTSDGNMPVYSFDEFCGGIQVDNAPKQQGCSYVTAHSVVDGIKKIKNKVIGPAANNGNFYNLTTTVTVKKDEANAFGFARFWRHNIMTFFIHFPSNQPAQDIIPPTCLISTAQAPEKQKELVLSSKKVISDGRYQFTSELGRPFISEFGYDLIISCTSVGDIPSGYIKMGIMDTLPSQKSELTYVPENFSYYEFSF